MRQAGRFGNPHNQYHWPNRPLGAFAWGVILASLFWVQWQNQRHDSCPSARTDSRCPMRVRKTDFYAVEL